MVFRDFLLLEKRVISDCKGVRAVICDPRIGCFLGIDKI